MTATVAHLDPGQASSDTQTRRAGVTPSDPALTLRQIMRARLALSEEPDPHSLARELADELPEDFVRDVIRAGLVSMLRQEISASRRRLSTPRHSRETNAAAAALWDVYSQRFPVADGWKLLGDFTRKDAEWSREQYEQRAAENVVWASRFDALAKKLTRGRTVRDALSPDETEAILNA